MRKKLSLALVAVTAMAFFGCASANARHHVTVSIVGAFSTLAAVQDFEQAMVCSRPGAPAPPQCVPIDVHRLISAKLALGFQFTADAARLMKAVPQGSPTPAEAIGLAVQTGAIVRDVIALIPESPSKTSVLARIGGR